MSVVVSLLTMVLIGPLTAGSAWAHGAQGLAFQGVSGPYLVSVFDGRIVDRSGLPEYRIVLTRDPGDGRAGAGAPVVPVPDARIIVTDDTGRDHQAPGIGNVYGVQLPDRDQKLRIAIAAAPGRTALTVTVHGPAGSASQPARNGPSTRSLLLTGGTTLLVLAGFGWLSRRRRSRNAPRPHDVA